MIGPNSTFLNKEARQTVGQFKGYLGISQVGLSYLRRPPRMAHTNRLDQLSLSSHISANIFYLLRWGQSILKETKFAEALLVKLSKYIQNAALINLF